MGLVVFLFLTQTNGGDSGHIYVEVGITLFAKPIPSNPVFAFFLFFFGSTCRI